MFTVTISGNAEGVEAEQEVVDFLRKFSAVFRQEGSPADLHNAVFNGSHTSTINLLSNPEPPVEEPPAPNPIKEDKPAWNTSLPSEVTFPSDLPEGTVLPADTEVHQSGPDSGDSYTRPNEVTTAPSQTPVPPASDIQNPAPPLTGNETPDDFSDSGGLPPVPGSENAGSADATEGGAPL